MAQAKQRFARGKITPAQLAEAERKYMTNYYDLYVQRAKARPESQPSTWKIVLRHLMH